MKDVHHIQRKILQTLLYAETLNYAAMRPAGVESNHYAYHLDKLLTEGLIAKNNKSYGLTPKGLAFIDRLSHDNMVVRLQPHIVTAIDITNEFGETLVCKRSFQPYINTFSFPLGKMHYDEPVLAAAQRELYEKTGLQDVPLTQRGIVYVTATKDDVVISKILCHVFQGSVLGRPQTASQKPGRGENSWVDHTSLASSECMPGFMAIKNLLAGSQQELFFAELSEAI